MATQTATAQPKRKPRTKRQDTPQPCPEPITASLQRLQQLKLPPGDGDRIESDWHIVSITLLDELVRNHLGEPTHYFCGGNMFIYYSIEQAEEIEQYVEAETPKRKPRFKGPDFFLVKGVDGTKPRDSWVVWREDGRYPDLVVEFISSSTRQKDVERNVVFYAQVFRVPEYFWFDRRTGELVGYRLTADGYVRIEPDARGWLWSEVLGAYVGVWRGEYRGRVWSWLRLWDSEGQLVLTREEREARAEERAEQERAAREQAEARAAQLQAELEQLRERLRQQGVISDDEPQP